jgi:DNA-binding PadR family transcriptional regulator
MRHLTNLEHLLLGLLHQKPASGYTLRKIFATTPLGHYSDSPGSIYPALNRLRRRGLVRPAKDQPTTGRGTLLLSLTPQGRAELRSWLQRPITLDEVRHDAEGVMLRFVFSAQVFGQCSARRLVLQLDTRANEIIRALESYLSGPGQSHPLTARLALEQGLEGYRALARWASRAGKELKRSSS